MSEQRPWEDFESPIAPSAPAPQAATAGPWQDYPSPIAAPAQTPPSPVVAKSDIFPVSKNAAGSYNFDLSAGIPGAVGRAFTLPGRVQGGEVQMPRTFDPQVNDPRANEVIAEAYNFGSLLGPRNPMVRSGDLPIPGEKMRTPDYRRFTPTSPQLLEKGGEGIEAYKTSGQTYPTSAVEQFVKDTRKGVGQYVKADPLTHEALDVLQAKTKSQPFITAADIDEFRQATSMASKKGERGAMQARSSLYDYLEGTGDTTLRDAIQNYAAGSRGTIVDTMLRKSEDAANPTRSLAAQAARQAESIRTRPRGFNDAELAALERAKTAGQGYETAANVIGGKNLAGQLVRGSLVAGPTLTGAITGMLPAAAPLAALLPEGAAAGLRGIGGAVRRGAVEDAGSLVRQRSPLFREQVAGQDVMPNTLRMRDAIANAMIRTQAQRPQLPAVERYDPENYL